MRASDGRQQHRLGPAGGAQAGPDWSPDGKLIAYDAGGDIWVMHSNGSDAVNLTRSPGSEFGAAWSPDGKQIAYVVRGKARRVFVMNADGSGGHAVGGAGNQFLPAWQPVR